MKEGVPNKRWELKKGQTAAFAKIDSSQLLLEVFNPVTPNAVSLSQYPVVGNFELFIKVEGMTRDSQLVPQVRLEVYNENAEEETISGVSVNPDAFYCYAGGTDPEHRDMRMINDHSGIMQIYRSGDIISCFAMFGNTSLTYSRTVTSDDMKVRLVFGSAVNGSGLVSARLDRFRAVTGWDTSISDPPVTDDDFDEVSW